ncbi:toprim domain-containing protein, partial [Mesorhizobium sp. M5C.F.Ca.IN.020.32.2.1]
TALTENQLELLWRMAGEPVLCFDGDQAGLKAAWRAADMALPAVQAGRSVRFALLPEGKDPDDLVKADGPDAFRAVLSEARPLADLLWVRETAGGIFDTPERRAELEKTLRELTSRIRDESLRYHYQQEMRERVLSFFGTQRSARQGYQGGRQDARPGGRFQGKGSAPGGQFARGGNAGGRTAITESLGRSALVKRGSEGM